MDSQHYNWIQEKMSHQKEKEKSKFSLPSSLKNIQEHYRNEAQSFAPPAKQQAQGHSRKQDKKSHSLFKLNPASANHVTQSIEILRKRCKSQRLESLSQPPKQAFSLEDNYKDVQERRIVEKKHIVKNYNIELTSVIVGQNKHQPAQMQVEEQPEKFEIVRPSEVAKQKNIEESPFFKPTIFQTPILPCFASEFRKRAPQLTKTVQEGEGLWKIGRIKVKGKKCELRIGEFLFEGDQVPGEGKAGLVTEKLLHTLPDWKNMWILQPHESLFTD